MQWEEEGGSVGREAAVWGGWVELGEFPGEDLQEERVKRQLGKSRPGQCREPASGSTASVSGTERMRVGEETAGEGQGAPEYVDSETFARP